jgi:sialic acid synthase SpsE
MAFVIAEVGSNWQSFEDAMTSINAAKQCGADAVKFQYYDEEKLFGYENATQVPLAGKLPAEWLPKLKEKATANGLEFMCTIFDYADVALLDTIVDRHKIASSDVTYPQLIQKIAETGKTTYMSVGASSLADVKLAVEHFQRNNGGPLVLMYCCSSYPSTEHNLFAIRKLKQTFPQIPVGYSCHTQDIYTPVSAVHHFGAVAVEKHFKYRDMNTPDSNHSLLPKKFKTMCAYIKSIDACENVWDQAEGEKPMYHRHNRRLVATKPITPGDVLKYGENFGHYRTVEDDLSGLHGFAWQKFDGKTAQMEVLQGRGIGPGVVG